MANATEDLWRKTKEFVLTMLVNFEDGLTAEQLHRNLGMLGDEFPFHKTVAELNAFLQRLVRDETSLEFAAGLYKVRT